MQQKKKSVYSKIADDILGKITSDIYPISSMLPPERELMEIYDVERTTVRRGLELLSNKGYIKKVAGLGSVVISKVEVSKEQAFENTSNEPTVAYKNNTEILALLPKEPFADSKLSYAVTDSLKELCNSKDIKLTVISGYDETQVKNALNSSHITSCVIFSNVPQNILSLLSQKNIYTVFALCKVKGYRCILPDISDTCQLCSQLLSSLGHTSVAFIGAEENSYVQKEYLSRFTSEISRTNPESNIEQFTNTGGSDEKSGFERLSELIRRSGGNFTAVVAINDDVAAGALKAAKYYRVSVPDDLSVISLFGCEENCSADSFYTNPRDIALEIINSCIYGSCTNTSSTVLCDFKQIQCNTTASVKSTKQSSRKLSDFLL